MYFFVHLSYYEDNTPEPRKAKVLLVADTYTEVIEQLDCHFGEESIEKITLLQPFTDNSVVYIDDVVETHIRENELNGF